MNFDLRLKKSTGNYETLDDLISACKHRKAQGLSNKAIGEIVGVSPATVSRHLSPPRVITVVPQETLTQQLNRLWRPPCLQGIVEE